jgi:hypothetical protein
MRKEERTFGVDEKYLLLQHSNCSSRSLSLERVYGLCHQKDWETEKTYTKILRFCLHVAVSLSRRAVLAENNVFSFQ